VAHSSSGGSPSMSVDGTMVGVPEPGMNEMFKKAGTNPTQIHGHFPEGGNQMVKPRGTSATSGEWATIGGNQQVKKG